MTLYAIKISDTVLSRLFFFLIEKRQESPEAATLWSLAVWIFLTGTPLTHEFLHQTYEIYNESKETSYTTYEEQTPEAVKL